GAPPSATAAPAPRAPASPAAADRCCAACASRPRTHRPRPRAPGPRAPRAAAPRSAESRSRWSPSPSTILHCLLLLDPAARRLGRLVLRIAQLLHHELLDLAAYERHRHLDLALELAARALATVERRDDVVAFH